MNSFKKIINKTEKKLRGEKHSKSLIVSKGLAIIIVYGDDPDGIFLHFHLLRRNLDEEGEDLTPEVFSARVEKTLAPKSSGKVTLGLVDMTAEVINPSKIWIQGKIELMRYSGSGVSTPSVVRKFIIFFDGKNQPRVEFSPFVCKVRNIVSENEILQEIEEADFLIPRAYSAAQTYQRTSKRKEKCSEKII